MDQESGGARDALRVTLARKYLWWKSPADALKFERRLIAQIMNIGDFEDVRTALAVFGRISFEDALRNADAGWFSPKSWAYWHYRSRLTPVGGLPPALPQRDFSK